MGLLNFLVKKSSKQEDIYKGYSKELREYSEYQDKYGEVWNLCGEYTEKINHYYSSYINSNSKDDFNNLLHYCQKYIELLPKLEEAKQEDIKINKTNYPQKTYCIAYHKLAMAYEKAGCYNSAINVCKEAIEKGYSDGTKGDFLSRIQRIKEKLEK